MSSKLDDVVPILLLAMYQCHMMELVVSKIEKLGVEILHIPNGCTSLCQLVDVDINKSLKAEIRKLLEDWTVNFHYKVQQQFCPSTGCQVGSRVVLSPGEGDPKCMAKKDTHDLFWMMMPLRVLKTVIFKLT